MTDSDKLLKNFLEEHFDFDELKKAGVYPKEIKRKDIHAQAARICQLFGYITVYEYGAKKIRAHISYLDGHRPMHVNESGELKSAPFVETFGGIYD
jgi:hypothetical protein